MYLSRLTDSIKDIARTGRFLRQSSCYRPRADDIYVVSYPRSGTTWVSYIVHLIVSHGHEEFDHISEVVPWFERSLALGRLKAEELNELPSPRVFKSHLVPRWLPKQGIFIYVRRRCEDIVVSYYNLYRGLLGYSGSFEHFLQRFLRGQVQYGNWLDHVAAWQRQMGDVGVLFVAYEDLKHDCETQIARIMAFLGRPSCATVRSKIGQATTFSTMKAAEHRFDHAMGEPERLKLEHKKKPEGYFLARGKIGTGEKVLNPAQRHELCQAEQDFRYRPHKIFDLPAFLR